MINGLRHHHHNHDNESTVTDSDSLTGTSPSHTRKGSIRKLFGSSPKSPEPTPLDAGAPKKKVSRQQQRKDRKAAEIAQVRRQAEEEVRSGAGKPDEAEIERQGIFAMCAALGVTMHEINPDGHCLFAAVADQLMLRRKVSHPIDYKATRRATAEEMRSHPDEYKPFISDSDEHMAGINNREAGTLHTEKAQDSKLYPHCSRRCLNPHTDLASDFPRLNLPRGRVLPRLLLSHREHWCMGRTCRDSGSHSRLQDTNQCHSVRLSCAQNGRGPIRGRTVAHFVSVRASKVDTMRQHADPVAYSYTFHLTLCCRYHRKMYGLGEHYNSLHPAAIQI